MNMVSRSRRSDQHELSEGVSLCVRVGMNPLIRIQCDLVLARNMVAEIEHPTCGPMKLVNTPVKYSHSEPSIRSAPPTLGQHTDEILGDILGMSEGDIERLKEEGVVS